MQKTKNEPQTTTNLILRTAGKTTVFLFVLLVLVCAFFLLLAPMRASDFLYSMGMKKFSAAMAQSAAQQTNEFDDWWDTLVKSTSANAYGRAYIAADKLEDHKDYSTKIKDKKITVGLVNYDASYYVTYNKAKCGLLAHHNDSERKLFWKYAEDTCMKASTVWGAYVSEINGTDYDRFSLNPIKGYIDALCIDKSIPLDNLMVKFKEMYNGDGEYNLTGWYSSKKKDLAYYVNKLCQARADDQNISETDRNFWADKSK